MSRDAGSGSAPQASPLISAVFAMNIRALRSKNS
jgi:hypothetical protein